MISFLEMNNFYYMLLLPFWRLPFDYVTSHTLVLTMSETWEKVSLM